jgi:branched-chain amino acid aminotransferase
VGASRCAPANQVLAIGFVFDFLLSNRWHYRDVSLQSMTVYLNGRFLPEEHATISVHDRGFLYGDGLFEGIRVYEGEPFLWRDHLARFQHGCALLKIVPPLSGGEMRQVVKETIERNAMPEGLLRITLSRGSGQRGYSPKGAGCPTLVVTPHLLPELPRSYRVILSTVQLLADDPISEFKNLNKLHQIVARSEADAANANESLLTNINGEVIEGTTTNVFWIKEGIVCTPPVCGILAGTTRAHVLRLCHKLKIPTAESNIRATELRKVDALFLTSCAAEIMPVSQLDGKKLGTSTLVRKLQQHFRTETFPEESKHVPRRR